MRTGQRAVIEVDDDMVAQDIGIGTAIPKGIRWAGRVAFSSEHPIHRLGAVLLQGGNLISSGHNKNRTHPKSPHKFCIHAEVDVLLQNRFGLLEGLTMYVVRITRGGQWATSKPCGKCWIMMREYGVEKVVYIDENGHIKKEDV